MNCYRACDLCEYFNRKLHQHLTSYLDNQKPARMLGAVEGMRETVSQMKRNLTRTNPPRSCSGCQYQDTSLPDVYSWEEYWKGIFRKMEDAIPAKRGAPVPEEIMV